MNFKIIKTKKGDLLLRRSDPINSVTIHYFSNKEGEEDICYEENIMFDYSSSARDFIANFSEKSALNWIETI